MGKKIKVLLLMDEIWNDSVYGNNNMTNWFKDFPNAEFAAICLSEGSPYNTCCEKYFQVTDKMMFNSIVLNKPAGVILEEKSYYKLDTAKPKKSASNSLIEKISSTHMDIFRLVRDCLWLWGKYDEKALTEFIKKFEPDVIFSMRRATIKMLRLERIVKKCYNAPIAAYTGDNELEEGVPMFSPFSILRRTMIRHALGKTAPMYSIYYTTSKEQAKAYAQNYAIKTGLLFKCAEADREKAHFKINSPIRFLYVGKLYCGRWKTLSAVSDALKKINCDEVKAILDIYTKDNVSKKQMEKLHDGRSSFLRGSISPDKIKDEYEKSDVVLHVESFDRKNRAITRHSYSTKVVDCLGSGCAVMAIGWEKHSACIELKNDESAIVVTDIKDLEDIINKLIKDPKTILMYAKKAMENIESKHSKKIIQGRLYNDFLQII